MRLRLSKEGLTLVELLVVIGIIAVLAGILYVAYGSVREAARQQVCMSNLRQIGQALQMYRHDWDGVEAEPGNYPGFWQLGVPCSFTPAYDYFREVYIKDKQILHCPNMPEGQQYLWQPWIPRPPEDTVGPPFEEWVKKRGEEAMVTYCDWHNTLPHPEILSRPYWETKLLILLRLNGKVSRIWVPVREWAPERW
jgi:prepilin-type N-terminal cleavage/methylation domain-containing protein